MKVIKIWVHEVCGTYKFCFSQMLLVMERYLTLKTSDPWKLVHKPCLEHPVVIIPNSNYIYLLQVKGLVQGKCQ